MWFGVCSTLAIVLLECISSSSAGKGQEGTYFVVSNGQFRPGRPYDVTVSILATRSRQPVRVQGIITYSVYDRKTRKSSKVTLVSKSKLFSRGKPGVLTIQPPSIDRYNYPRWSSYNLEVRGSGGLTFSKNTHIGMSWKSVSLFLQTDKGMYKPGQTIRMRVFGIHPNTLPYTGKLNVHVTAPDGTRIKEWINVNDKTTGVIPLDLALSDQPLLGKYRINVNATGYRYRGIDKSIEVKKYVLPKFEVTVDLPPFSVVKDKQIKATVTAKYTYGKPVEGTGVLGIRHKYRWQRRNSKTPYGITRSFRLVDGKADMSFTLSELTAALGSLQHRKFTFSANVTETLTKIKLSGSSDINIHATPYKLKFLPFSPSNFKPGMIYNGYVQVSQQDDSPVVNPKSLKVTMTFSKRVLKPWNWRPEPRPIGPIRLLSQAKRSVWGPVGGCLRVTYEDIQKLTKFVSVSREGIAEISMTPRKNADRVIIEADYIGDVKRSNYVNRMHSPSNTFIQLRLMSRKPKAGQLAVFHLKSSQRLRSFSYQIYARGKLVLTKQVWVHGHSTNTQIKIRLTPNMAPSARMVVFYVKADKEVIADAINFKVDGAIQNRMSLRFNKRKAQPGAQCRLQARADRKSTVYLLGVDQSVLLLSKGNDITRQQVDKELAGFDNVYVPYFLDYWWPSYIGGTDVASIFRNAGTRVLTDANLYTHREERGNCWSPRFFSRGGFGGTPGLSGSNIAEIASVVKTSSSLDGGLQKVDRIRTAFPETWLWTNFTVGSGGSHQLSLTVPDTITSWYASAFAMNSRTGMGVVDTPAKLEVFKPFFVTMNLPDFVIRGEDVILQVIVFNYLGNDARVKLTLVGSKHFQSIMIKNGRETLSSASQFQHVMVPKGKGKSAVFAIRLSKLGSVDIQVKAQSHYAADAVRRPLLVEPEGVSDEQSQVVLVKLDGGRVKERVNINLPNGFVSDTDKTTVSVVGDFLGPTISGLNKLIRTSYGCGEQNMVNFVPNILVVKYLERLGKLPKDLFKKAKLYMEKGYQREMTYRHNDGSFSAFGSRDKSGSLWLTAFVVKSFEQAKSYIYIDEKMLQRSVTWITGHQNKKTGMFTEPGSVHSFSLKGGASQGISLTAFVLIALMENSANNNPKVLKSIKLAQTALEREGMRYRGDPFVMAITTYALTLVKSSKASSFQRQLDSLATYRRGLKYWTKPTPPSRYSWYYRPNSGNIEMTAYALSVYAVKKDVNGGLPVIRWLAKQRNPYGGFSSTQDTVVALQALTEYAFLTMTGSVTDLRIKAASDCVANKCAWFHDFIVNDANAITTQSEMLPTTPRKVDITARGTGFAIVQVSTSYNILHLPIDPSFDITAKVLHEDKNKIQVKTCARWLKTGSSGMAIIELGIPTGFQSGKENVGERPELKRIEQEDRKLVLYFDQITAKTTCITFDAERVAMVARTKQVPITVYDYYEPDNRATTYYLPKILQRTSVCDVCEGECDLEC